MRIVGIWGFSLCLAWPFLNASATTTHDLDTEISVVMEQFDCIGLSVIVVKNNKVSFQNTYGYNPDYSDESKRNRIPNNGIYWWASVSKTFISTAIMQLAERGVVSLEDDVNKYLDFDVRNPTYPNTAITIQMLLCHRSSLNDTKYRMGFDMLIPEKNRNYKKNYNDYEPGKGYDYCNLNYNLLAAIVEKASGKRFDIYVKDNICKSLGLSGSYNKLDLDSNMFVKTYCFNQKTKRYNKYIPYRHYTNESLKNYVLGLSTPTFSPAGGMRATTMDLAKWMMVHMNYGTYKKTRVLSRESELEMWKPRSPGRNYGYAFSHYDKIVKGESFVGMTGGSCGIHSLFFCNPEKKYGFVVICNGCTSKWGNGGNMNYEIVRVLYKHFIKK